MSKKLTKEEFIRRAREVHGDKYDYSKTDYINNHTKVTIICPEHGEFEQIPYHHLNNHGCPKCANRNVTIDDFIEKARKIHGDKYDYSRTNYVGSKIKTTIICPEHGEFEQTPGGHLSGYGCPKCAALTKTVGRRLSIEKFIEKAKEVHGDKYDYSKVVYINNHTKVTIVCPIHGEFEQTPHDHLSGKGCIKCVRPNSSLTKEEFIEKAKEVHGDKYDYSKVVYINSTTPVTIVCPEHGEFLQKPINHLRGSGCHKCTGLIRLTTSEFIEKAKEVHGDKYDYSKVVYINNHTKVTIVCPIHGEFEQIPNTHLLGCGCPICAGNIKLSTDEFVEKARKIHGDKYIYDKVNYVNNSTKVIITCPIHGEFEQVPYKHLIGHGCPRCISYKLEDDIENLLTTSSILFEPQKTFDWLQNKSNLYLDFYLPDYNIAIECQGVQHFQNIEYFGGEEGFKYRLQNDKLKLDLCTEHGIKVIYYSDLGIDYPYEVFEDLDEILKIIKNI